MVSMLTSSVADRVVVSWLAYSPRELQTMGSSPGRIKPKTIKLFASPLSKQY